MLSKHNFIFSDYNLEDLFKISFLDYIV